MELIWKDYPNLYQFTNTDSNLQTQTYQKIFKTTAAYLFLQNLFIPYMADIFTCKGHGINNPSVIKMAAK